MNIENIEDEVTLFCSEFFEEEADVAEECIDFLEANDLYVPKENYTVMPEFLDSIIKKFRVLDSAFMSATLFKVNKDLQKLKNIYDNLKEKSLNPKKVFNEDFLEFSDTLYNAQESENYKALKKIYYEVFTALFFDDRKYYIESILEVLNSKAYYCDKLLWKEARESNFIKKHFQVNKISDKLNSKNYLLHATSMMRPYTKEYDYYQSCIRIYK